jgi:hypothetical protein
LRAFARQTHPAYDGLATPALFKCRDRIASLESRRRKKTQGMNRDQVLAFFDKDKALSALSQVRQAAALRSKTHA